MKSGLVSIRTSSEKIDISWEACNEIIVRAHIVGSSAGTLIEAFKRHGTLSTVSLSHHEKPVLLGILERWLEDVGTEGLPEGVWDLRNALSDDVGIGLRPGPMKLPY